MFQVHAHWQRGFQLTCTAAGHLLSGDSCPVAVQLAVAVARDLGVRFDTLLRHFSVGLERDACRELASVLISTKSLPILEFPLGVRLSVMGTTTVAGQQAEIAISHALALSLAG